MKPKDGTEVQKGGRPKSQYAATIYAKKRVLANNSGVMARLLDIAIWLSASLRLAA